MKITGRWFGLAFTVAIALLVGPSGAGDQLCMVGGIFG